MAKFIIFRMVDGVVRQSFIESLNLMTAERQVLTLYPNEFIPIIKVNPEDENPSFKDINSKKRTWNEITGSLSSETASISE